MQFSTRRVRFVYMALKIALLGPGAFSQTLDLRAAQEAPLPQELTARLRSAVAAAASRPRPVADADWAHLLVGFDPRSEGGRQKLCQLARRPAAGPPVAGVGSDPARGRSPR